MPEITDCRSVCPHRKTCPSAPPASSFDPVSFDCRNQYRSHWWGTGEALLLVPRWSFLTCHQSLARCDRKQWVLDTRNHKFQPVTACCMAVHVGTLKDRCEKLQIAEACAHIARPPASSLICAWTLGSLRSCVLRLQKSIQKSLVGNRRGASVGSKTVFCPHVTNRWHGVIEWARAPSSSMN